MKKLMILGASILQLPAICRAKEMGLDVIAVDMDANAVGFNVKGVVKEVISTIDIPAVLKCAKKHKINGIMTLASDMPMRTIATVSKELGLVGISEDTALKATNKVIMRQTLYNNNVPIPMFFKVQSFQEMEKAILEVNNEGFKCIVKPADNSGSRGVTLLPNLDYDTLFRAYRHALKYSRSGEIVVEEYMEGEEVSVESISVNGECHVLQITDKLTTGAPYFVEMGHNQPSMLDEEVKIKIVDVAKKAVKAIGIKDGPSHTEIKVTKEGPKIVEIGARLGGDCITTHLVPLSTGIDVVECCIKIALGDKADISKKFSKGSAIRYLDAKQGIIKNIIGVENALACKGIIEVNIVHGIGDISSEIKSSVDRVGFIIAQGEDAKDAIELCNKAKAMIEVDVE